MAVYCSTLLTTLKTWETSLPNRGLGRQREEVSVESAGCCWLLFLAHRLQRRGGSGDGAFFQGERPPAALLLHFWCLTVAAWGGPKSRLQGETKDPNSSGGLVPPGQGMSFFQSLPKAAARALWELNAVMLSPLVLSGPSVAALMSVRPGGFWGAVWPRRFGEEHCEEAHTRGGRYLPVGGSHGKLTVIPT